MKNVIEFRLNQQSIHPLDICRRVVRQTAFGKQRLVKQNMRQVVEMDLPGIAVDFFH